MENETLSRRSLLQAIAGLIATAATPIGWEEVAHAFDEIQSTQPANGSKTSFLSASEAADVEAVAAQIIPTDDTPGAREAGVIHFIDRALATFYSQLGSDYRAQLAAFQAACHGRHPGLSFALLTNDQQIDFLKSVDETPFFNTTRLLTLLGMF